MCSFGCLRFDFLIVLRLGGVFWFGFICVVWVVLIVVWADARLLWGCLYLFVSVVCLVWIVWW